MLKIVLFASLAVVVQAQESFVETSLTKLHEMLLQQCKNNNAENKAPEVEEGFRSFVHCIQGLINREELNNEIEAAKSNGTLDEVFKKYCDKTPQLKTCIHTLMDKVAPCVDTADREHFNDAKNTTDQMMEFICQKDGDRIALFIAEGGPECFKSKVDDMKPCANNFKESFSDIKTAKALNTAGRCGKFDELSACIVSKLETCSNPTPANMAESLYKYVRKATPCHTALPPTLLRRTIKDYEVTFEQQNSRKVQRDDKKGHEEEYMRYKTIKARIKLLNAL